MNAGWWIPALALLLFVPVGVAAGTAPPASLEPVVGVSHYVPQVGDSFQFHEVIAITNGTGDYAGYQESDFVNGTRTITAVPTNLTVSATFQDSLTWVNNQGESSTGPSVTSGAFTFSAATFQYVSGTDNQTGYTDPFVWFFMDNSLPERASFSLLNTPMTVVSTNVSYYLPSTSTYVKTLFAEGNGSYARSDAYGNLSATYSWRTYFDPATGYIVGYVYTEQDSNATAGFSWVDTLYVTSTTFPLTPGVAPSPPANSGSGGGVPYLYIGLAVFAVIIVLVIVLVVALRRRARRGPALPKHSATGRVAYAPAPPPPMGVPPPVNLTPGGQPAVQQVVIRETVKVKCQYCGALIDSTAAACPFCGAPRS